MTDALREALQELVDADDALAAHQARGYMVGDAWDFDDTQRRLSARRAEARTAARTALQEPAPVVQPDTGVVYERGYWQGIEDAGNRAESLRPAWGTAALEIAAAIRNIAVGGSQLVEDARVKVIEQALTKAREVIVSRMQVDLPGTDVTEFAIVRELDAAIRSIAKGVES